jgi:hypothetical protein
MVRGAAQCRQLIPLVLMPNRVANAYRCNAPSPATRNRRPVSRPTEAPRHPVASASKPVQAARGHGQQGTSAAYRTLKGRHLKHQVVPRSIRVFPEAELRKNFATKPNQEKTPGNRGFFAFVVDF